MFFYKINQASIRQGQGTPLLLPIVTRPILQETPSMTIITNLIIKGKFTFCMASSCQHQCFEKQNNLMRQTLTRFGEGILLKLQGTLEDRWDLFQMVDQSPG